ncbi:MAG: hypothetical protein RIF32_08615 [Leptospirales bacterium]|jgi:hypothetical protein
MFDEESRYFNLETVKIKGADRREIAYKKRRFLPRGESLQTLAEVTIGAGDRLDQVSGRTLGNSEQFWQVADANNAMDPNSLTSTPGDRIRIPVPEANF